MQVVPHDLVVAVSRWARAYEDYERVQCEPRAASELVLASQRLKAAWDDSRITELDRDGIDRLGADGGKGAS